MTEAHNANDRRSDARVPLRLTGKLFHPASGRQVNCLVTDLSSSGAGLWCEQPLPADAVLTVFIDGFGRLDCRTCGDGSGHTAVRFTDETQRTHLKDALIAFLQDGMKAVTRTRRTDRTAPDALIGHFRRANGEAIACDVLDISLKGASLKTRQRPPVGEIVHLGGTRGWVVRHSEAGVGVQFLEHRA